MGVRKIPWRKARQPTPGFLLGQRSLAAWSPQGHKELDTPEVTWHTQKLQLIYHHPNPPRKSSKFPVPSLETGSLLKLKWVHTVGWAPSPMWLMHLFIFFKGQRPDTRRTSSEDRQETEWHTCQGTKISSQAREARREASNRLHKEPNLPTPSFLVCRTTSKGTFEVWATQSVVLHCGCRNKLNHRFAWICLLPFWFWHKCSSLPGCLTSKHHSPSAIIYNTT